MPTIQINRRIVSTDVSRRAPIGKHEYFLEFTVLVEETGCYTLKVSLFDHDDVTGDDYIGSTNNNLLDCYCIQAGTTKMFHVYGAGRAPENSALPQPSAGSTGLPGITGRWPESDGPFDNTLEVFARVELFVCRKGACNAANCTPIEVRRLGASIFSRETARGDVNIGDGTGPEEGVELIEKGVGAGVSAGTSFFSLRTTPGAPDAAALLANLQRRVVAIERNLSMAGRGGAPAAQESDSPASPLGGVSGISLQPATILASLHDRVVAIERKLDSLTKRGGSSPLPPDEDV